KLRAADLLLARTEVEEARGLLGPGQTALVTATHDLRRALGVVDQPLTLQGGLEVAVPAGDVEALTNDALERRPDLRARQAAVARWNAARAGADTYRTRVLPSLQTGVEGVQKLFEQGEPGVDVLRIIDLRRKLLRARDSYLTAQWDMTQAQADLVAATGDIT